MAGGAKAEVFPTFRRMRVPHPLDCILRSRHLPPRALALAEHTIQQLVCPGAARRCGRSSGDLARNPGSDFGLWIWRARGLALHSERALCWPGMEACVWGLGGEGRDQIS